MDTIARVVPGSPRIAAASKPSPPGSSRERLLETGRQRFATSGFAGARLVDIAADAGLTTGSLYRHFPSKAALFEALFEEFADDLFAGLVAATDYAGYCERWLGCNRRHQGAVRAAEEVSRENPAFLEHRRRQRRLWADAVIPHLPAGLDARGRRLTANLTVDILDYFSFTVSRGWSDHPDGVTAANLARLVHSGLYLRDVEGVSPRRRSSAEPTGPEEDGPLKLMTWAPAPGRVEPTSRRGRAHRDEILDAAAKVFAARGFDKSGVVEIAAGAGVSPATVYRYFSDKYDIFRYLLSTVRSKLYTNALISLDDSGRMMIEPEVLEYLRVHREHVAVYRVWRELLDPGSEMEQAWAWIRGDFQQRIARVVRFGQRGGLISAEYEPEVTAELIVASSEGPAHTLIDLGWDEGTSDAELARLLGRILGSGLKPGQTAADAP